MFDIGFPELMVIAVVGLLVIGPERLPEALRTLGLWIGRLRRSFTNVKTEIEKEIGMDEIRRQLHNEAVMEEMKRIERDVRQSIDTGTVDGERKADSGSQHPAVPDGTDGSPEAGMPPEAELPADVAPSDKEAHAPTAGTGTDKHG